jgi:hypothetical protein
LAGFTLALLVWAIPVLAQADRVVLYPLGGDAEQARLDAIEEQIATILRAQGHTLVPPPVAEAPESSAEMNGVAEAVNANYVVVAEVEPLRGQYRFEIHVYYRPAGRLEDLVATVLEAEENARLSDILSSMVRREGLGADALRLTGEEAPPAQGETDEARREAEEAAQREAEAQRAEEERLRREAEEAARQEAQAQAQREADQAARREEEAQRAWNERPRYGADGHWMIQLGGAGRYAAPLGNLPAMVQGGGGLFDVSARVGRTFDGLEGFELRGGIDYTGGVLSALSLHVGAAWLGSFFVEPFYIGAGGEVGVIFPFTGSREVGFSGRVGALVAWRPVPHLVIEASLPEIGVITPGTGAITIGGSLRVGYRFE